MTGVVEGLRGRAAKRDQTEGGGDKGRRELWTIMQRSSHFFSATEQKRTFEVIVAHSGRVCSFEVRAKGRWGSQGGLEDERWSGHPERAAT